MSATELSRSKEEGGGGGGEASSSAHSLPKNAPLRILQWPLKLSFSAAPNIEAAAAAAPGLFSSQFLRWSLTCCNFTRASDWLTHTGSYRLSLFLCLLPGASTNRNLVHLVTAVLPVIDVKEEEEKLHIAARGGGSWQHEGLLSIDPLKSVRRCPVAPTVAGEREEPIRTRLPGTN